MVKKRARQAERDAKRMVKTVFAKCLSEAPYHLVEDKIPVPELADIVGSYAVELHSNKFEDAMYFGHIYCTKLHGAMGRVHFENEIKKQVKQDAHPIIQAHWKQRLEIDIEYYRPWTSATFCNYFSCYRDILNSSQKVCPCSSPLTRNSLELRVNQYIMRLKHEARKRRKRLL